MDKRYKNRHQQERKLLLQSTRTRKNEKWAYGFIYPRTEEQEKKGYVNARTVNYIVKYITKIDRDHEGFKSIILTSAGIGKNYTQTRQAEGNLYKPGQTVESYTNTRASNLQY